MTITIKTVSHSNQRYCTVGDWSFDKKGNLTIKVSDMKNKWYFCLVAIHELIEAILCEKRGITDASVTKFDEKFEKIRTYRNYMDEPGDEPDAPYENEHCIATGIERTFCSALGIKWKLYERAVNAL